MSVIEREVEREKRKRAGHNVPKAGSLAELSYCKDCGDCYTSTEPCTGPDGVVRDAAYYKGLGL